MTVSCNKILFKSILPISDSAALAVTGAWKGTSHEKLYEELGWESLSLRRWGKTLILFYKFVYNITPDYTRCPIPKLQQAEYSLRRSDIIGQINTRTMSFKNSFILIVCLNGTNIPCLDAACIAGLN